MFNDKKTFNFADIHDYVDNRENDMFEEERQNLKAYLEVQDEAIFNNPSRITQGYCAHDKKKRTIITTFGRITINRRRYYYYDGNKRKYICLLDNAVGINAYERVHESLKQRITQIIATGNRYCDILEKFEHAGISAMTITRIIKNLEIEEITDPNNYNLEKIKVEDVLNIQMDDGFLNTKEQDGLWKQRTRLVTMNTGHDEKKSTIRRKVVANKRGFAITVDQKIKINTADFIKRTMQQANLFYDISPKTKIIFRGDGAKWITNSSNYQENSFFILDKFHSCKKLYELFPTWKNPINQQKYDLVVDLFKKGNLVELIDFLKNVEVAEKKQDKLKEIISYFKTNADGVYNQNLLKNDIGCHIESDISHTVKWLLGYGSKTYSKIVFKKLLAIKIARQNGIDVAKVLKSNMKHNLKVKKWF